MEMENSIIKMVVGMMVNGNLIKWMAMEKCFIKMEILLIKDNGKMINFMVIII